MTTMLRTATFALMLATLPFAGACGRHPAPADATADAGTAGADAGKPRTTIGKVVAREIDKARVELREGNVPIGGDGIDIDVNGRHYGHGKDDDGRPHAAISPAGDLLVEGKAVDITPAQRAVLLEYRGEVVAVAEAGMTIGAKGADLAGAAIGEAIGSIFSGDTDKMEHRVEAQAETLKQEAKVLCGHLPAMLATQQKLAASLPAFRPYATMTQDDVDDCEKDIDDKGAWSK